MNKGDIVCCQMEVYPRPEYGKKYEPKIIFMPERPPRKSVSKMIAYWRIKKIKKPNINCNICSRIIEEEAHYCEISDCPHRN